jgi:hypothetical protein
MFMWQPASAGITSSSSLGGQCGSATLTGRLSHALLDASIAFHSLAVGVLVT